MVTGKPLYTVNQIQDKVRELANRISADYEGKDLLVVPILKGAFMFASDLVRQIRVPLTVDFIMAASYHQDESSGEVAVYYDIRERVTDRDVLLVEDIVDTGITLNKLSERILEKRPRSLKICGLFNKSARRVVDVPVEYIGFDVPDLFIVGYGLDYDNKFRNLPYVAVFKKNREDV